MFGAANALFSGLAFAGVAYAILLQRAELRTQVRELKLSREELAKQREQLREQAIALRKQNFESTFFQLVRLQNDIVAAMSVKHPRDPKVEFSGRAAFKFFADWFRDRWSRAGSTNVAVANEQYEIFYKQYESYLGHYFRSLYNLVKLVDASEVEDKELYTNLVRAQISSDEQIVLFYNGLSRWAKKFKPLVEKYAFLKTITDEQLLHPSHRSFYAQGAFGKA
jgi:hypothetical protein